VVAPGVLYLSGVANSGPGTPFGDATAAYNTAAGLAFTANETGINLGGLTLTPGVYFFSSSAELTGMLTLNDEGNPNAQFVFQIGSTLTTASNSSVVFINGGQDSNVWWQVGSSATLGTDTAFGGNIIANSAAITLDTGASITCGSAIALGASVTLNDNNVSTAGCAAPASESVPEPGTLSLLALGFCGIPFLGNKKRRAGK
jgi:type VI secretion system secreted protein VgrG